MSGVDQGPMPNPMPQQPVSHEAPHATFVVGEDTAHLLSGAVVQRAFNNPKRWITFGAVWGAITVALVWFWGLGAIVLTGFIATMTLLLQMVQRGKKAWKQAEQLAAASPPGTVITSRFGPDAVELVSARGAIRYHYTLIKRIYTDRPGVIVIHHGAFYLAHARELFPDWAIAMIQHKGRNTAATDLPALPPIPPVENPTSVFVPTADTARTLATAYRWQKLRSTIPILALSLLPYLVIGALPPMRPALIIGLCITAAFAGLQALSIALTWRDVDESYRTGFPAGHPVSTHFGDNELEIQTANFRARIPYSKFRSLQPRGTTILLRTTAHSAYPRELFPDNEIQRIRAARRKGARISER
ncbi:YcxB family protein [Nocardia heshunensis]